MNLKILTLTLVIFLNNGSDLAANKEPVVGTSELVPSIDILAPAVIDPMYTFESTCDECMVKDNKNWWSPTGVNKGRCGSDSTFVCPMDDGECYQNCDKWKKYVQTREQCAAAQNTCDDCASIDGCFWFKDSCHSFCSVFDSNCWSFAIRDVQKCSLAKKVCPCPRTYFPVCGTNKKTYSNRCELKCAEVKKLHNGACQPLGKICPCDRTLHIVCGSNGKTYNNDCLATCNGAQIVSEGRCKRTKCPKKESNLPENCIDAGFKENSVCNYGYLKCPSDPPKKKGIPTIIYSCAVDGNWMQAIADIRCPNDDFVVPWKAVEPPMSKRGNSCPMESPAANASCDIIGQKCKFNYVMCPEEKDTRGKPTTFASCTVEGFWLIAETDFMCPPDKNGNPGIPINVPPKTNALEKLCPCDKTLHIVCGSDGKTYNNNCLAKCNGAKIVSEGRCKRNDCKCGGFCVVQGDMAGFFDANCKCELNLSLQESACKNVEGLVTPILPVVPVPFIDMGCDEKLKSKNPCRPAACGPDGQWVYAIVDCMSDMAPELCHSGIWIEAKPGQCCSECQDENNKPTRTEPCNDGDEDNSEPCEPAICKNNKWIVRIIECVEFFLEGSCAGGKYVDVPGQCCRECVTDNNLKPAIKITNKDCDSCVAQGKEYWWAMGRCGPESVCPLDAPFCYQDCDQMRNDVTLNKKCSAAQGSCNECAGIKGCQWYNNECSTACALFDSKCVQLAVMDAATCEKPVTEAKYFCNSKQYTTDEIEKFGEEIPTKSTSNIYMVFVTKNLNKIVKSLKKKKGVQVTYKGRAMKFFIMKTKKDSIILQLLHNPNVEVVECDSESHIATEPETVSVTSENASGAIPLTRVQKMIQLDSKGQILTSKFSSSMIMLSGFVGCLFMVPAFVIQLFLYFRFVAPPMKRKSQLQDVDLSSRWVTIEDEGYMIE